MEEINNEIIVETPKKRVKDMTKEELSAYQKLVNQRYRAKNKEKFNAAQLQRYYDNIRTDPVKMRKIADQKKEHYLANREKKIEYSKQYMKKIYARSKKLHELELMFLI